MPEFEISDLVDDDVVFLVEVPPLPHGLKLLLVGRKGMRYGPPKQHATNRLHMRVSRPNAARILKLRESGVAIERLVEQSRPEN